MDKFEVELIRNRQLLKALLALQLKCQAVEATTEKPELLLARFGIGYQDIADILGKKPDAVRMLLKRRKV